MFIVCTLTSVRKLIKSHNQNFIANSQSTKKFTYSSWFPTFGVIQKNWGFSKRLEIHKYFEEKIASMPNRSMIVTAFETYSYF